MEKQEKLYQSIMVVALITGLLLLVPLVAMQFTSEVVWTAFDFLIIGAILFGSGLSFKLIIDRSPNIVYRIAIGMAIGTALLMVWANLAVGLIGSGPNLGNLMYVGVIAVGTIGAFRSEFRPKGMETTMYATGFALGVLAVTALLLNLQEHPGSSVIEIIGVNAFFAALFCVAGFVFRLAGQTNTG